MKNKILPAIFLLALSILFYYSFINKNGSEIPVTQTATAPEINDDWYNTVTRSIIESEYNFREIKDNKYEAVNRRNNMRFSLSPTGFLASERIENIWNVSFELKNIYTGDAKLKLNDNPEILNEEQTLTYQFNSYAIEYLNDASGLRQNFIIEDNESNQSTLKVELQIHSDLQKELLDATKLVIKDNASE
ncbi:MAG: hypothetical protein H7Y00_04160, partial [Fimbriimonadaceae bacterium]|nr:hypothetical protein [Chitinophagales bacterium]